MKPTRILALCFAALIGCDTAAPGKTAGEAGRETEPDTDEVETIDRELSGVGGAEEDCGVLEPCISWAGAWTIAVEYVVECARDGEVQSNAFSGEWAIELSGSNLALTGALEAGAFTLEGAGGDDSLELEGAFPLRGVQGAALAEGSDLYLYADEVPTLYDASGMLLGSYATEAGESCEIIDSAFAMSR